MNTSRSFWRNGPAIERWNDVARLEKKFFGKPLVKWVFRAEKSDANRMLKTNLEQSFELNGIRNEDKRTREWELIRDFQRKAALYLEHEPDKDDILEWLAIMRHRDAPTRLLDWTYSFYIAVYFALNENREGVVWALNAAPISKPEPMVQKICDQTNGFREFSVALLRFLKQSDFLGIRAQGDKLIDLAIASHLIEHPLQCVYPVNPFRLNKRLSVQQGLFLMAGDITRSFAKNLTATFGGTGETRKYLWKVKVAPGEKDRKDILRKLRDMNITNEALFPGLDGFARSVGEGLAYPRPLDSR